MDTFCNTKDWYGMRLLVVKKCILYNPVWFSKELVVVGINNAWIGGKASYLDVRPQHKDQTKLDVKVQLLLIHKAPMSFSVHLAQRPLLK